MYAARMGGIKAIEAGLRGLMGIVKGSLKQVRGLIEVIVAACMLQCIGPVSSGQAFQEQ
jgi:hypothetical protein